MKQLILGLCMGFVAAVAMVSAANAMEPAMYADSSLGKVLVDTKGMTLYVFDKDTKDTSTCYDACAKAWPPYLAKKGEKAKGEGWTMIKRKDGTEQWAYDGKPLYLFVKDMKAGEAMGDGMKGVWHTVKE